MHPYAIESAPSATILTVPGLMNSGAGHWQSIWESELPNCHRAELGSWDAPHRNSWVSNLSHAIGRIDGPVILAAHSLGCHAVAWWAAFECSEWSDKIVGALLVAPPELESGRSTPGCAVSPRRPRHCCLSPRSSSLVAAIPISRSEGQGCWRNSGAVSSRTLAKWAISTPIPAWATGHLAVSCCPAWASRWNRAMMAVRSPANRNAARRRPCSTGFEPVSTYLIGIERSLRATTNPPCGLHPAWRVF